MWTSNSISVSEDAPVNPTSPYGLSKAVRDEYIKIYTELHNINIVGLRCFQRILSRSDW